MSASRFSIDWIGDVPEGWKVIPLCRLVSTDDDCVADDLGGRTEFDYVDISSVDHVEGIVRTSRLSAADAPSRARRLARTGDVVVSTVRTYLKAIAEVTAAHADCIFSTGFAVLRPRSTHLAEGYLKWAMLNELLIQAIEAHSEGLSYPAINTPELAKLKLVVPPRDDQKKIATYLKAAVARIDGLVSKKVRFIELLREKREALITHAVTKGLDATEAAKDSGTAWLGDIPSSWDTAPLRVFLKQRRSVVGAASAQTRLLSLTLNGVIERDMDNPTGKIPATFDTYQKVSNGDMVFCLFDIDETPRTVGLATSDGMITSAYCVLEPSSDLWANYLYYLFLHVDAHKRLKTFYKGMRKTIRPSAFLSIPVPRPPEHVAADIVRHLDEATARIDLLISKTERSIELLREHRAALITAAVTGKLDLREAA